MSQKTPQVRKPWGAMIEPGMDLNFCMAGEESEGRCWIKVGGGWYAVGRSFFSGGGLPRGGEIIKRGVWDGGRF